MLASKLKDNFPIPTKPHCAVSSQEKWSDIEKKSGIQLPTDYKVFIGVYGTGIVGDFINLFNPFSTYKPFNLLNNVERTLKIQREFQEQEGLSRYYPPTGEVLPFADTYNGDTLFWKTEGDPDNWTVYIQAVRSPRYEQYAMNMTDFFIELLNRPYSKNPLLKQSRILTSNIVRKKPFVSIWVYLEQYFADLKDMLKSVSRESNHEVSKAVLEKPLKQFGFDLETPELKEQLQNWQQEQFIELVGDDEIYLKIINHQ